MTPTCSGEGHQYSFVLLSYMIVFLLRVSRVLSAKVVYSLHRQLCVYFSPAIQVLR